MNMYHKQRGAGLIEILVALLLLAVGVLGFAALQLRAFEATHESVYRVQAMNLAKDMAERIRANRYMWDRYQTRISTAAEQANYSKDCYKEFCTDAELADFDVAQVRHRADSLGMTFNLAICQGAGMVDSGIYKKRRCLYVAWNETSATDGTDTTACTNGSSYRNNSQCIILETY